MKNIDRSIQFPRDNFQLRVTEESFTQSKGSGNPMIVLEFEVLAPETAEVGGVQYNVAGTKPSKKYFVVKVLDKDGNVDADKTENCVEKLKDLYGKFELPFPEDLENPSMGFKGKIVWGLMNTEMSEKRKAPTAEQLAKDIKDGDILKDPITGKPLVNYYPFVEDIFGLSKDQTLGASKPF